MVKQFTEEELMMVEEMSGMNIRQSEICKRLGVTNKEFTRNPILRKAWLKPEKKGRQTVMFTDEQEEMMVGLAKINCTMEEIAMIMNCSVDTIERRSQLHQRIKEAKTMGKASVRRMQYESARNGNTTMQIWLGKQLLGQRDKDDNGVAGLTPEELRQAIRADVKLMMGTIPRPHDCDGDDDDES